MNKQEEREEILNGGADIDTAQNYFLALLEKLSKEHAKEIIMDQQSLTGSLDLSVLKDRGFTNVSALKITHPGKIVELRNIPVSVKRLICRDQLLVETDLPSGSNLEEIDLTGNILQFFDAKHAPNVKILRLSDNRLSKIDHLPESLETLECNDNQIRRLDLSSTPQLKSLHCNNNPLLMLERVPDTLIDLKMENNPFTEISYKTGTGEASAAGKTDKKFEYLETLNEYFKLKGAYEQKLKKLRTTAYNKIEGSKKAKSLRAKSVKAPCINCQRKVGTIFKTHNRKYTAVCGDTVKPCSLNIQIFNGNYMPIDDILQVYGGHVQELKEKIIIQKMDTLFNYVSERLAVSDFKRILEEFNSASLEYKKQKDKYDDIVSNEARKRNLEKKEGEIARIQEDIDNIMEQYKKTGDRRFIQDAVKLQVDDYIPAVQNVRLLKYETMIMEDEDENVSRLVQREVAIQRMDELYGEPARVVKYVMNRT
jgi:hypothetical protein